jgi:hypothetical protein
MLCPCWLGPDGDPDRDWCAGVFAFDIREGESDGIKLDGSRVAFTGEWPGNFFAGKGTLRVYIDEQATEDQRRELEAIFSGRKGGHLEGLLGAVITKRLPAQVAKIEILWGDKRPSPSAASDELHCSPSRTQLVGQPRCRVRPRRPGSRSKAWTWPAATVAAGLIPTCAREKATPARYTPSTGLRRTLDQRLHARGP